MLVFGEGTMVYRVIAGWNGWNWLEWVDFWKNEDIPSYGWAKAMVIHKPLKNALFLGGGELGG